MKPFVKRNYLLHCTVRLCIGTVGMGERKFEQFWAGHSPWLVVNVRIRCRLTYQDAGQHSNARGRLGAAGLHGHGPALASYWLVGWRPANQGPGSAATALSHAPATRPLLGRQQCSHALSEESRRASTGQRGEALFHVPAVVRGHGVGSHGRL